MKKPGKTIRQHSVNHAPEMLALPYGFRISYRNAVLIFILILTFLLYTRALRNDFLIGWDDGEYLSEKVISESGPINMPEIFSNFNLGMYQPLAILSFAINHRTSGPTASAFILTNILLHLLNTYLTFRLTERWMRKSPGDRPWIPAGIVALLFAIHPMHVEAVVWISTRSSALYSAFFLGGLIAWDKYLENGKKTGQYLAVLALATLSMLSKSMAATFPLVMILIDFIRKRKFSRAVILEKLPFLALSVVFGIVAIKASASFGHITILEQEYSIAGRLALIVYGISFYIRKLFSPTGLSAIYAFPEMEGGHLPSYVYTSAFWVVAAILVIVLPKRYRREFLFGGFFFLLTISMVLPLFWSRIFIVADRYTYIPYIGLFMIVARLLTDLWDIRSSIDRSTQKLMILTTLLVFLMLGITSFNRIGVWKDTPTLLADVVEKKRSEADMAHGYFYLAGYYDAAGEAGEAMKYYDLALSRNPKYLLAYNNRGILKGRAGENAAAIKDFEAAIRIKPDYAEAYYNRGIAVYQAGDPHGACSDFEKARSLGFRQAAETINRYCRDALPEATEAIKVN